MIFRETTKENFRFSSHFYKVNERLLKKRLFPYQVKVQVLLGYHFLLTDLTFFVIIVLVSFLAFIVYASLFTFFTYVIPIFKYKIGIYILLKENLFMQTRSIKSKYSSLSTTGLFYSKNISNIKRKSFC